MGSPWAGCLYGLSLIPSDDFAVMIRRALASLARPCDFLFAVVWLGSAAGHGWLLWDRWGGLTPLQAATISLAVLCSLALVPLSHWMCARPERLLAVALLVCVAHVPADSVAAQAIQIVPVLAAIFGIAVPIALGGPLSLGTQADLGLAHLPSGHARARALPLPFSLLRRPPPASS